LFFDPPAQFQSKGQVLLHFRFGADAAGVQQFHQARHRIEERKAEGDR
jgi:hypothetical protein